MILDVPYSGDTSKNDPSSNTPLEDHARVVRLPLVPRDQRQQPFVATRRIVRLIALRRHLPDVVRHVAQELLHLGDCVRLVLGGVVDHPADLSVDLGTPEVVLVDVVAERRLHHRRSAGEHLSGPLRDHAEMAERGNRRQPAGGRPQHGRRYRRDVQDRADRLELGAVGDVGATDLREFSHAATRAIEQVHRRQPQLHGAGMAVPHIDASAMGAGRAAPDREVLPGHVDAASADLRDPSHPRRRLHVEERSVVVVRGAAPQLAHLLERTGVDQQFDPLADVELSLPPLTFEAFRSPHLLGERVPAIQLIDVGLPGHRGLLGSYGRAVIGSSRQSSRSTGVR